MVLIDKELGIERLLNWHTAMNPRIEAVIWYAKLTRPVRERLRDASIGSTKVIAFVVALLGACRPLTVIGRIRAVVINALNGVFRRGAQAHICIEVLEGIQPTFAHDDTASAIVRPFEALGISTSLFDVTPSIVFSRAAHMVSGTHSGNRFSLQATTTSRKPVCQAVGYNGDFIATVTKATPMSSMPDIAREGKYQKPAESLSSVIFHEHILSQLRRICKSEHNRQ